MLVLSLDDALVRKARKMPSVTTEHNYLWRTYLTGGLFYWHYGTPKRNNLYRSAKRMPPHYIRVLVFYNHDTEWGLCPPDGRIVGPGQKATHCSEGPESRGSRHGFPSQHWGFSALHSLQWPGTGCLCWRNGRWWHGGLLLLSGQSNRKSLTASLGDSLLRLWNLTAKFWSLRLLKPMDWFECLLATWNKAKEDLKLKGDRWPGLCSNHSAEKSLGKGAEGSWLVYILSNL